MIGAPLMKELLEAGSKHVKQVESGQLELVGGSMAKMVIDLHEMMELVEQLKARLDVQQELLAAYKGELERVRGLAIAGV